MGELQVAIGFRILNIADNLDINLGPQYDDGFLL